MASDTDRRWIHRLSKGGLHRSLGVPEGEKIPEGKIRAAAGQKHNMKLRRQALAAITLKKLRKRKGKAA